MLIEIKSWLTGTVLHSGDFSSLKDCVEDAVQKKISLYYAKLNFAELNSAKLNGAKLNYAELNDKTSLDYSCLQLSCKTLKAKFSKKHLIQILYHAAMPTQHNVIELDTDIQKLFNSNMFKKVVNKFHRVYESGEFIGVKEKNKMKCV